MSSRIEVQPHRVVVDPNVLVAALISKSGPPAQLLDAARDGRVAIVAPPQLFVELVVCLQNKYVVWGYAR